MPFAPTRRGGEFSAFATPGLRPLSRTLSGANLTACLRDESLLGVDLGQKQASIKAILYSSQPSGMNAFGARPRL